ncbi:TetR/AcrR family transcriptional regulator [Kineothrix sedimenti]|uniref:TetR/AcrR family transcriptional regulator n=1 Tax=Kineothrix sedimenti TaxID=3123317 RepID=A0ABZ3EVX8_9FIRM
MRTIKAGEERRKEILLTARKLFVQKGYDQTSINDILKIVDIAKGTFYYYYSSKEEVLQAIIMDIVYEGAARAEQILQDTSIPLLKRIVMAVMAQAPEFEGAHKLAEELHKVDNAKLEQQYRKVMLKKMTSVLEGAVKEAGEQDIIHTDFPKECIESLLLMGHMMFDCDTFLWKAEEYPVKVKAFLCNAERMFGAKEGEFQEFMEMFE